jgi:hypothetical protein
MTCSEYPNKLHLLTVPTSHGDMKFEKRRLKSISGLETVDRSKIKMIRKIENNNLPGTNEVIDGIPKASEM